jgi:hypothetical protein
MVWSRLPHGQTPSWRIIPWLRCATAYSVSSQLSSISGGRVVNLHLRRRHAVVKREPPYMDSYIYPYILSHVSVTIDGVRIAIRFTDHLQVVTTKSITLLGILFLYKSLHAHFPSLFPLAFSMRFLQTDL